MSPSTNEGSSPDLFVCSIYWVTLQFVTTTDNVRESFYSSIPKSVPSCSGFLHSLLCKG